MVYRSGESPHPTYRERARGERATFQVELEGAVVAPASGTFTLLDPAGVVLLTGNVAISDSVAYFDITAADLPATLSLGRGYREDWALVFGSDDPQIFSRDVVLVRTKPYPVLTDSDITDVYSDLGRHLPSGVTTWQTQRNAAWKVILGRLEGQGVFPEGIVTSWALREVHFELTCHYIGRDNKKTTGDRWDGMAADHKKEFELAWKRLRFRTDSDGDGAADSELASASEGVTHLNGAPAQSWGGGFGL